MRELRGPLAVVGGVAGVGWDEYVVITLADGSVRHGLVLDVNRDVAAVEVMEGTAGMDPAGAAYRFSGEPLRVPVGTGWLGRTCNGRGEPIDGAPPVTGAQRVSVNGDPLNPVQRDAPSEPVLTGVSVIDALTNLVRGQKLPVFSLGPHQPATPSRVLGDAVRRRSHRRDRESATRRAKAAHLDPAMHLQAWDSSTAARFDQQLWAELTSLRFLADAYNVLVMGPVGVGKTFLANALGHIAVRRHHSVHTERADKLFKRLRGHAWTAATKTRCANCTASNC